MSAVRSESIDIHPVANRSLGRQFIFNSVATGGFYALSLVIGLWYTRFTVHKLGVANLAVVSLAAGFINYLAFVAISVSASVGRFVLADFARGDIAAANCTFNSFLVAAERVTLILVAAIAGIVWFVVPLLDYPAGQLNTTRFVFAAILGSCILQIWSMCFDSAIWISGRIDIRYAILTTELLIRSGTVFILFTMTQPQLWHIALACAVAPLSALVLYYIAWKKLTPELSISRAQFDQGRFREIRGMGGWLLVMQVGTALQFNTDLLLLNLLLGREIQGSYGLLLTWVNILRGLFGSMGQLLSPSLAALQANEDSEKITDLSSKAVRMQGLLISIPVGVLCGLSSPALNWWLGPNFTFLAPLTWLILVPLVLEGSFYPAFILIQSPATIPFAAKASVAMGLLNVVLGVTLVKFTSLGMYGIALSTAATSLIRHGLVLPAYAASVLHKPWYTYIQQQSQGLIQLGLTGVIAFYTSQYLASGSRSFGSLVTAALLSGSVATCFVLLQLSHAERARLTGLIRRR